jgi:hypothetical protein
MSEAELNTMLSQLNYSPKWLEYGILTKKILERQFAELDQGDDDNTEFCTANLQALFLRTAGRYCKNRV